MSDADLLEHFVCLGEAEIEPPEWVIKGLLPTGITFLVGPPKSMKSTIEMAFSMMVAGQQCEVLPPDLRDVPDPGIVVGMSAEASPGELRYMVERGFGAAPRDDRSVLLFADPWSFRLDDPGAMARLLGMLSSVSAKLFWLDPLVDFHSVDEKDAGEMNRLLRPLQRWAKANRAAALIVHHTRKLGASDEDRNLRASDARGSSSIFGLADGLITLTGRSGAPNRVHMDVVIKRGTSWSRTVDLKVWSK
jgi:RecA-family ATPase